MAATSGDRNLICLIILLILGILPGIIYALFGPSIGTLIVLLIMAIIPGLVYLIFHH